MIAARSCSLAPLAWGAGSCSLFALLALLAGCGGGPRARVVSAADALDVAGALDAYEDYAAIEGSDVHLLSRVAGALLLVEACGADPERASLAARELAQGGLAGRPLLAEVVHRDCAGGFDAAVLLARRGDEDARRLLRGMADRPEPAVRAAVVIALSPELDRDMLLQWARDPEDDVRAAASERLGALGPSDVDALAVLVDNARDPSERVRSHAVRALGSFEAAAFEPLRERFSDPESSVRMAAVEALVRADRAGARQTLLDLLATPPSAEGIEAARALVSLIRPDEAPTDDDRVASLSYLDAVLGHSSPSLRAQASVVLAGLPGRDELGPRLEAVLAHETDPTAKLSMARALLRRESDTGRIAALAALRELSSLAGMAGVQSAAVLAEEGDGPGLETLRAIAVSGASDTALRVVALHALGRLVPEELEPVLHDEDPAARMAAASAILSGSGT